ncbi:HAD family hydrolase [Solicola sp. PLA-1-18]|uniref:HAD family hydrolase n=1 Tax=Solicola sp. PLA-1-18 TaxID=3380532 RepID=UPI003B7DBF8D
MTGEPTTAVLMDIDGTLVDSNYLHVDAWVKAFADVGASVDSWRVHRRIGMDGSRLVAELLGASDDPRADDVKQAHSRHYADRADELSVLDGGRELVAALAARGLTVVLATSAPEDELEKLRGLLEIEDDVDVVTSGDDASQAKPAPDVVRVALDRAGVSPGRAVMVGDAVWDMEAATTVGVRAVGLLSGGIGADELRRAGAVEVWEGPRDLLDGLDRSAVGGPA